MVDRILIGAHSTFGMGLYISQPGIDVNIANKFQMAWSTLFEQFQILSSGSFSINGDALNPAWTATFTWANLGYRPIIFLSADKYPIVLEYITTNSARMRRATYDEINTADGDGTENGNTTCYYYVTRSVLP